MSTPRADEPPPNRPLHVPAHASYAQAEPQVNAWDVGQTAGCATSGGMKTLRYVGPRDIRERCVGMPEGTPIRSRADLMNWLAHAGKEDKGWATFVVNIDGALLLAPRRSEHVACAGGRDVLAAGELQFDSAGTVRDASNQSTGYCPPESSWEHLQTALDRAGIARPSGFTFEVHFRRCPNCGERNLVKDDWYVCTFCDEDLPVTWNFDQDAE